MSVSSPVAHFKALELRREMFQRRLGVPQAQRRPLTIPHSPAITKRSSSRTSARAPLTHSRFARPSLTVRDNTNVASHGPTKAEPFSFATDARLGSKQSRPSPRKERHSTWTRELTKPETPKFTRRPTRRRRIKKEEPKFRAKPVPKSLYQAPNVRKKVARTTARVPHFELASDRRARRRAEFDARQAARMAQMELEAKLEHEEREKMAEADVYSTRQELPKFKARPIAQAAPVCVEQSHTTLTIAQSPCFATDRLQRRRSFAVDNLM